jgi:hypothetical protein
VHRPAIAAALCHEPAPGRRNPETEALILRRDALIREAAQFYPCGSDRERAKALAQDWSVYAGNRWKNDRHEERCPAHYRGRKEAAFYKLAALNLQQRGEELIRKVLGSEPPLFPTQSIGDSEHESENAAR